MKIKAYETYNNGVEFDTDTVIVSLWNAYVECRGEEKISLNNKEFFENSFENSFDAAWAVSLSNKWDWRDEYVYFNGEGYLTSFSHWDDERSPIDLDKLDISQLIDDLKKWHKKDNSICNNIPRAIHDALKEI